MLGAEYSGSGLVGGGYDYEPEYMGSGLVGGKLPGQLRATLAKNNVYYAAQIERGQALYKRMVAEGKLGKKGSEQAKARGQQAAATRRENKGLAIELTQRVISTNPYITPHEADSIYKDYKKAVSADRKYEKQLAYRTKKAKEAGKPVPYAKLGKGAHVAAVSASLSGRTIRTKAEIDALRKAREEAAKEAALRKAARAAQGEHKAPG